MLDFCSAQMDELFARLDLKPEIISHEIILLLSDPEFDEQARDMLCDFLDLVLDEPRASYYRRLKNSKSVN